MRGINKVILVGTLGKDPETKNFPNGGSVTNMSIATSESWVDKNTGERKEQTEWHRIVLHNRLGEIAQQYLRKGSKVYIEGSLRTRQWTDQNGQERYSTEVRADIMQAIDGNPNQGQGDGNQGYNNQGQNQGQGNSNQGYHNQGQGNSNQGYNNQNGGYGNQGRGYGNHNQGSNNPNRSNGNQGQNQNANFDDKLPF